MKKGILVIKTLMVLMLVSLAGCASLQSKQQHAVENYAKVAAQISLGMDKQAVKQILDPSQSCLTPPQTKLPDQYMEGEILVEILYFRSGWQRDGIVTDDEFTPYIFNDGVLVAVGWVTLGGPKTQAQALPENTIYSHRAAVYF